jgi:hypothetical protein
MDRFMLLFLRVNLCNSSSEANVVTGYLSDDSSNFALT